jgi:tRNA dimethylallyltransferase
MPPVTAPPLLPSLVGPTGTGKTAVAVAAAGRAGLEILSADSRQVYRRLDVGTAKPTAAERAAAPHHLVDVADPEEIYTAARFAREAHAAAAAIRGRGRTPLLVGGSGLYVRAAEEGLFTGPAADPAVRARLAAFGDAEGDEALHALLAEADPETAARLHPRDRVRVVRALEVLELTGVPLSEHHRRHREAAPPARTLRFGLDWDPAVLATRLAERVDRMLATGWIEETAALLAAGVPEDAPALYALGYPEIRGHLAGRVARAELRDRIVTATRRFAKRQRTWFRAVPDVRWLSVAGAADLAAAAETVATAIARARGESP